MIHWFLNFTSESEGSQGLRRCSAVRRRLSMERCEDRRMLSGNGSVFELSAVTPAETGGFLLFDNAHLFATASGAGLVAAPTSSIAFDVEVLNNSWGSDQVLQWNGQVLEENEHGLFWSASNAQRALDQKVALPSTDLVNSRYTIGVFNFAESVAFDELVPTADDAPSTYLSPSLELLDGFPRSAPLDLDDSLTVDPPASDHPLENINELEDTTEPAPALPLEISVDGAGQSPRLLVIDEPNPDFGWLREQHARALGRRRHDSNLRRGRRHAAGV